MVISHPYLDSKIFNDYSDYSVFCIASLISGALPNKISENSASAVSVTNVPRALSATGINVENKRHTFPI